jgi:hypothetical protein
MHGVASRVKTAGDGNRIADMQRADGCFIDRSVEFYESHLVSFEPGFVAAATFNGVRTSHQEVGECHVRMRQRDVKIDEDSASHYRAALRCRRSDQNIPAAASRDAFRRSDRQPASIALRDSTIFSAARYPFA